MIIDARALYAAVAEFVDPDTGDILEPWERLPAPVREAWHERAAELQHAARHNPLKRIQSAAHGVEKQGGS